uniref:Uncharacterized protein n=1 Tax=Arundo donax TaxID=35708 RepID=A0A0A8ZW97_ARUDO
MAIELATFDRLPSRNNEEANPRLPVYRLPG